MDNNPTHSHKVVIYNQTYTLRSEHDVDYIQQLADHVNQRMSEIASATMTVDSLRVAILAALQIADELYQARREIQETEEEIAERSTKYADLLDEFLRSSATEINK
jgi:cell division protein ZapA